jgi:fatty acid-binding protein DegV
MATVKADLVTVDTPQPAGQTFAQYVYNILAADGTTVVQTMSSTATSVTFSADVPAGAYTISVTAMDAANAPMGAAVTAAFTVPVAASNFAAPQTVTVTLS